MCFSMAFLIVVCFFHCGNFYLYHISDTIPAAAYAIDASLDRSEEFNVLCQSLLYVVL